MFGEPARPSLGVTRGQDLSDIDIRIVTGDIHMATIKVTKILGSTDDDLPAIFSAIEFAENSSELERSLERFNRIMRVFLIAAFDKRANGIIHRAIMTLGCSHRFQTHLNLTQTLKDALIAYKTEVMKKLAIDFQRAELLTREDKALDKALLTYDIPKELPEPRDKDLIYQMYMARSFP